MFKTAVIFVSLLFLVGGDIYDICTSLQWEGIQHVVTGTEEAGITTMIQNTIQFSFDVNNSRIAASTSGFQDGHPFQKDFLFLYQQKTVYVIEDGKCHAEYLDKAFPPHCLPGNFTWTWWRTWYGFPKMDDQLWIFGYDGHVNDLHYHVQLFLELMTPASHQIFGNYNNEPVFQTTEVVNTTRGIKNPDVFTPPPSCKDSKPQGTYKTPVYLLGATFPRVSAGPVKGDIYQVCSRRQWEGIHYVTTGTEEAGVPTVIQNTIQFSFDVNNSMIAASTSGSQDGRQFQKDFLFLYQQKTVYVLEDGNCHAEHLVNGFPPHCLPRNFTWEWARTWYGFELQDDELLIFGYSGHVDDLHYKIQMSGELMTSALQQIIGHYNNEPFFQTSDIVNTTRGIKNPDVFTLPSSCKTAKVEGTYVTPKYLLGATFPRDLSA